MVQIRMKYQTDKGLLYIRFAIEHSLEDTIPVIAALNDREMIGEVRVSN